MDNYELQKDEIAGKIYDGNLFKKLIKYLKPYKTYVVLSFVFLILISLAELAIPLITKSAVDNNVVSDKFPVQFPSEQVQLDFKNKYPKFTYYTYQDKYLAVISTKQKNFLAKKDLIYLQQNHYLNLEKVVLINATTRNKEILADSPYLQISPELLAIDLKEINKFSLSNIVKLRDNDYKQIKFLAWLFLITILLKFVFTYFQVYITNFASQHAMNDLRRELFAHLQRMPLSFFDKNPIGRLVTRVTNDIRSLDEMLSSGIITLLQDSVMILTIMIVMLILNWQLALVSFIILPCVVVLMIFYKQRTRIVYREVRKKVAALNATLAEHISGVKIIQLFNQYYHKKAFFANINKDYYNASISQLKLFAFFRPLINITQQIAIALILWYGGGQILHNVITIGMFIAFTSYLRNLFEPINDFSEKFDILQAAMAGAERIFDLFDQPEDDYKEQLSSKLKFQGEIEFRNVWLRYNDDSGDVLKNISFKVKPGEKIALVGHTGSGKTSIVSLIVGMYPYQKGEILFDGKSLHEYSLHDLRSNVGIVQQDVFLFSGTIKDNIVLNNHEISDARMKQVAEYVNVHKFIEALPGQYMEPVMERGATFSVGQRQLISFARVLAYNPSIFVLDEATSNIDTETEILIQDALKKLMDNRTSIIIAHRLSTIQHVDRILVLHKGEIVEEGSHQELLQKEGLYYDLYRLQYK